MIQDSINSVLGTGERVAKTKKFLGMGGASNVGANNFAGEPQMKLNNLTAYALAENSLQTNLEAKRRQQQMFNSSLTSFYGGKD